MEQIEQLFQILKSTPEMALWGVSIYFIFILLKLSSWIVALKLILSQLIKRYFDYKETKSNNEKDRLLKELYIKETELQNKIQLETNDEFKKVLDESIYGDKVSVLKFFVELGNGKKLFSSDFTRIIKLVKENEKN